MYKSLIRPLFFLVAPERIHHIVFVLLKSMRAVPGLKAIVNKAFRVQDDRLKRTVFGLTFDNPVGLAAGFDKDAKAFEELSAFGFGFIEIGTLTPRPQDGNPRPRMFRLPEDESLINRMGFNNEGVFSAVKRLKSRKTKILIGGNIGKNKITPNEEAVKDYERCFEALFEYVDYFVVNVSSPNTPNLRELQDKAPLTALLNRLQSLNKQYEHSKPVLLKIAPDLTESQLDDIIDIVKITGIAGVVATNTTISRDHLKTSYDTISAIGMGGLSGKVLKDRSTEVIRYLHAESGGTFPIIGVGGIHSEEDALEKLDAGASLVQLYTGFIYEGPALIKRINKALLARMSN